VAKGVVDLGPGGVQERASSEGSCG
jgi:hypothetical protein